MENTPGRGEHFAVGTLPALNQVAQEHGGHHGGGHPPLVEAGGDVQVSRGGGVGADIGDAVQAHAVLGGPVEFLGGMGVVPSGKRPQLPPATALLSCAVATTPDQQQVPVIAEGQAGSGLVHIHAAL